MKFSFFISSIVLLSTALAATSGHNDKCFANHSEGLCKPRSHCSGESVSSRSCSRGEDCCIPKKAPRPESCHNRKGHSGFCKKDRDCSRGDTIKDAHCSGHSEVCCASHRR